MKWNDIMIGTMGILPGSISNMTVAFAPIKIWIQILMKIDGETVEIGCPVEWNVFSSNNRLSEDAGTGPLREALDAIDQQL